MQPPSVFAKVEMSLHHSLMPFSLAYALATLNSKYRLSDTLLLISPLRSASEI